MSDHQITISEQPSLDGCGQVRAMAACSCGEYMSDWLSSKGRARAAGEQHIRRVTQTSARKRIEPLPLYYRNAIRLRRERLGWTCRRLASEVGIHEAQMSNIERGRSGVYATTLLRVFEALGTPLEPAA